MENIREGAVELANIVKKCDALDAVTRGLVDVGGFTEDDRVGCNTTHVSTGLGVVGVDGVEQRFQSRRAQSLGSDANVVFAVEQPGRRGADG